MHQAVISAIMAGGAFSLYPSLSGRFRESIIPDRVDRLDQFVGPGPRHYLPALFSEGIGRQKPRECIDTDGEITAMRHFADALMGRVTPTKILEGVLVGLIFAALGLVFFLGPVPERPRSSLEITPFLPSTGTDTILALPNSTMKAQPLVLPFSGKLTVQVSSRDAEEFNLYLVQVQSDQRPSEAKEFTILPEFTAERVHSYERQAPVSRGVYLLTLINSAGKNDRPNPSLNIRAKLDP